MNKKVSTKLIARVGVLSAVAAVLYLLPGIPIIPPIYKLDFSNAPVLLGGFSLGCIPGLLILIIKDLIGLFNSSSMGVGELADFMTGATMMLCAVLIYKKNRTLKGALIGLVTGIVATVLVSALVNYYIMVPFYVSAFHMSEEAIVGMIGKVIPAVDTLPKLILLATMPFNLLKCVIITLITFLLYKRISPLLKNI